MYGDEVKRRSTGLTILDDLQTGSHTTPDRGDSKHCTDGFSNTAPTTNDLALVTFGDHEANQYPAVLSDALSHANCILVFNNAHSDKFNELLHDHVPTAIAGAFLCRRDYPLPPKELGDSFTRLSAPAQPFPCFIVINVKRVRAGAGVVMPYDLDKSSVPWRSLVGHHDTIMRLLTEALSS